MRVYNTIEEMNEVAKSQWRTFWSARSSGEIVQRWSDKELWEISQEAMTNADETGIYFDGETQMYTMEMEAWARGTMDGTWDEIEILDDPAPVVIEKSIWQQRLESLVVNNLRDYAHSHWKDGEEEDQQRLLAIVDRICNNEVADNEWDEILEEVML